MIIFSDLKINYFVLYNAIKILPKYCQKCDLEASP